MSRVGKKPILIPEGVEVKIDGQKIMIKGPLGENSQDFRQEIKVELKEGKIFVLPQLPIEKIEKDKQTKAFWGLTRALISNMVKGVIGGFEKKLEIAGVGFKAVIEGETLLLYVGYTHPIKIKIPQGIKISIEKNIVTVFGINRELVGQIAAVIRKAKPAEPYKGKGIKYVGEIIKRKVGKKVVTTTSAA